MRRAFLLAAVSIGVIAAGLWFFQKPSTARVVESSAERITTELPTALAIKQVVLFSSGVGCFQREGAVEGNAQVDLSFPVTDVNDLLKSLVLLDLNGGRISTVSYDSNAPLERTLKSFAVNLTDNPSFGAILTQARGEKVEVVLQQTNATQPGALSGAVIGIEKQKIAVAKDAVDVEVLNLWCSDGVRALKMSEIQRLRFLNPILDSEFKRALETLAQAHDTRKKTVSINCVGEGKRNVRVSYVIENPIWKTSYRLVLDKKRQPYLQGWAVIENPTDEDWKDVRLALVSGRPISFQMDLYQPLFAPRPVVEPELFASLRPPTYSGDLSDDVSSTAKFRTPEEVRLRVATLMKLFNALYKEGKYAEARICALKARELDPDNGVAAAAVQIARDGTNITNADNIKEGREEFWLHGIQEAERMPDGEVVTDDITLEKDPKRQARRTNRQQLAISTLRKNEKEREIERRLGMPVNMNFTDTPLRQVLDDVRTFYGINVWTDDNAAVAEGIDLNRPVTMKLEQISLRSALKLLLKGSRLTYLVKDDVLQITTESEARAGLAGQPGIGSSVPSAASAARLGSFFHYTIDRTVTIPRQKSAMLPIVGKDVEGTRVSIYNEKTQAKFPLLGVRLKNTSGLHLNQGPITVFEGSNYAGDLRILDLQPNEERLISYALDLGAEVNAVPASDNGRIVSVKAVKGILETATKMRESKTYTMKNRNDVERLILIEHPVRNDFKLVETEKPVETAADFYRFQVNVAPDKTASLTVTEEQILSQSISLAGAGDEQLRFFLGQQIISKKVKDGMQRAIDLRSTLNRTQRETTELQRQLDEVVKDQVRLRANLKEMPATAEAYKRYLKKFDDQETQIEDCQAKIKNLQGLEHNQKKVFEDYLANFSAE
jgi:hypothetical protein